MAPLKHEDRFLAEHNVDAALARSRYGRQPANAGRKPTTTNRDDDADGDGETGDLAGCFGVFDGHVNASASSYVERHMLRALLDQGADGRGAILETCCTDAFRQLESSYRKMGAASPQSSLAKPDPKRRASAVGDRRSSACLPRCLFSSTASSSNATNASNAAVAIEGGTTACVALLQMLPWGADPRVDVVVANAGDSGALLVYNGGDGRDAKEDPAKEEDAKEDDAAKDDARRAAYRTPRTKWLTRCHSPDDPLEAKRLTDAGARLGRMRREGNEIGPMRSYPGGYAVSRAIGDFDAPHVVCTPEVKRTRAPAEGCVLVLASDGVWNVVSEDACGDIVRATAPCVKLAAERIMEAALGTERGLHDDATVVVVRVPPPTEILDEKLRKLREEEEKLRASEVAASAQVEVTRQDSSTSTTTTASTSEPVPRKSWTRRLSVGGGGTKSQIEKLRAEMEDDITVRRGRVSLDETSSDGSTHRTYAKMDGLNAIEGLGLKAPEDGSVDGDSNNKDENEEGEYDSASKGEEEPRDFRNQKMRSLEDRGNANAGGLFHGCVAFLCGGGGGGHSATVGFDDVAGDGRNLHDDYDVGKLLGRGSYGSVRECTLRVIPSKATVEHLKPRAVKSIASNGSRYSAALIRDEVDTMLAVSGRHPNLPTVYDVYEKRHKGVAPGTTVHVVNIVTEQYGGGDLLEGIARRKRFTVSDFEAIALQLLGATSFLHNVGVVHRDIKPDNIMLRRHWFEGVPPQIVLLDFGGAAFARGANKTKLRGNVGTKFYSAPEVVSGREYGAKADVWSVGVTLMVLLAGVPPPHRIAKDWKRILGGEVLRLPRGTPPRFGRLVAHMLVPVPETRPSATAALSSAAWLLGDGRMLSWRAAKEAQMRSRKDSGGVDKGPDKFRPDTQGSGPRGSVAIGAASPKTMSRFAPGAASASSRSDGSPLGPKFAGYDLEPAWKSSVRKKESTVHWTFPKSASDPTPAMPPRRPSIDQELHGAARRARADSRRSKFERAAAFVLSVALGRDKTAALVSALREAGYDEGYAHRRGRAKVGGANDGEDGANDDGEDGASDDEDGASDLVSAEALEAALWKIDAVDAAMQIEILRREATDQTTEKNRESGTDCTDEETGTDDDELPRGSARTSVDRGSGVSVEFSRVLTLAELHDNHARINRTVRNEYIESRGTDDDEDGRFIPAHFMGGKIRNRDDHSLKEGMLMATLTRDEGSLSAAIEGKEGSFYSATIVEEDEEEDGDGDTQLNVGVQALRRASQSGENLCAVEEAALALVRSGDGDSNG